MTKSLRNFLICSVLCCLLAVSGWAGAKNVIIMIADGWDYNQTAALKYYTGNNPTYSNLKVQYPSSTYSASTMKNALSGTKPGYDPAAAWIRGADGVLKPSQDYFHGPATDSAASATALATGRKTTDGYVNMSISKEPLVSIARFAKQAGKSAGSISSVQWSHATPAVFGDAHNSSRGGYAEIAKEMVNSDIDVIMGAGNPLFDDNGNPATRTYDMVGGKETWDKLVASQFPNITLLQTVQDFHKLASASNPKGKYIGTAQVSGTLQQSRSAGDSNSVHLETFNKNVPSLALMTSAAINALSQNPNGFFLMVEGGAVDWANHSNQTGRMIEEMISFDEAVGTVIDWIKRNGGWNKNLLIVTGDHDSGLLLGPNGETDIVDNGKGKLPGMKFFSSGHSNMIIPMFAQGAGSEMFRMLLSKDVDPVRGRWVDNTDIFRVMKSQIAN